MYRAECSTDAIHAPFVAGISGDAKEGAYSVALSGGYDDDVDLGYALYAQVIIHSYA
jgi:E3 ubiquitin-protein ligase UHRF1